MKDEDNIRESSFTSGYSFGTIIKQEPCKFALYTSESSASFPVILDAVEDDVLGRCKSEEGTIHSTVEFHMVSERRRGYPGINFETSE